MKKTRMLAWILTAILLLGCTVFPAGAEGEAALIFYVVAADDDSAWVYTNNGLMHFSSDGEVIAGPLYPDADDYAIDPDGNIYYAIGGNIIKTDATGAEVAHWETGIYALAKIAVNERYILVTGANSIGAVNEYMVIDKDTNEMRGGIADGKLKDIEFYDEETFLLLQAGPGRLFRKEYSTLEEVEAYSPGMYDGIALCGTGGPQYLYVKNYIDRLQDFESELEEYLILSGNQSVNDIYMTDKTIWCVANFELKHYLRSDLEAKAARKPEKTLYIVGVNNSDHHIDQRVERTIELFNEEYPEYAVAFKAQRVDESVKTAIMANSPGYDLLLIDSMASASIKNSGVLADLSKNEVILKNLEEYIDMPFLWEEDGRLFGVPDLVLPYTMKIKPAELDQIEGGIPQSWTWEDFAALADDAEELGLCLVQDSKFWKVLLEQYTSVYCDFITGEADYSNDTFRRLVTIWKELSDNGSVCYDRSKRALLTYDAASATQIYNAAQYVYLGMPTLNGETVIPVYMTGYYVNRYSENVDAAIRFLEIYSSVEVQRTCTALGNGTFLPDWRMYDDYDLLEQFGLCPPDEDMEIWQSLLSQGKLIERDFNYDRRTEELVIDLLNDRLTVDEFVSEMQENADLMIGE